MGWGSAGQIFDPVVHELIDAGVGEPALGRVCYRLARVLRDGDWDTEDESVAEFRGHPVVQHAVRKMQGHIELVTADGDIAGAMEYYRDEDVWYRRNQAGAIVQEAAAAVAGFNMLIAYWEREHGGAVDGDEYRLA